MTNGRFQDKEHFVRLALVLAAALIVFLVLRSVLVPEDFGRLGHYRERALADNRSLPVAFAGHAACEECHDDVAQARAGGRHERVACEACHGALAAHAEDPDALTPSLPDPRTLCLGCHSRLAGRPASFPQILADEHAGDQACSDCHAPHSPEVE